MEFYLSDLCGYCKALEMKECPLLSAKQRDSDTHSRLSAIIEARQVRTSDPESANDLEKKQAYIDRIYISETRWIRRTANDRECPFGSEL